MSELLLEALGRKVREHRKAKGLTAKALAASAGLSERFVGELEAGRANISVLNLEAVAKALGTSLVTLLEPAPSTDKVVALLGLRGAGKSTVGQALATRLGVPFFELDRLVEQAAGMRLQELFAIHGEGYFRELELEALRGFLETHPTGVLATGGGLVTSPRAYELLLERARTVWLKASPKDHWGRVVKQGDLRPMQNRPHAMAELQRRLEEREPLYRRAELELMTSGRTVGQLVDQLSRWTAAA